jgi:hypothetical protein
MTARPTQAFFPFVPDYSTWDEWNGNLVIYYGREPIMVDKEENWRSVADEVSSLATFAAYPVPAHDEFDTWQDWAREFTTIINGPSR